MAERATPLSYEFDPTAEVDYVDAVGFYEEEAGMGAAFEAEVRRAIDFILENPEASPIVTREGARKRVLHRFPFNLCYTIESQRIRIWAVAHHKRRPGFWAERLR